ncbi:MAG TPA: MFS transporter [Anaerolineae bacterium]|nr:MFS transporter [Anaerolineae bacterium]
MDQAHRTTALSAKIGLSAREQWLLATLMLPSAMELIDSGMLAVALPRIQADFGVPVDVLSWAVAAGFLPRVTLMPVYGHIGDLFGKKRLFVLGLTVFLVGATLGIFAPSFSWLVVGRLLQGLGSSSLPLAMALIAAEFPYDRRGRALGIWNTAAPVGIILGPVLGGFIINAFGWHAMFVFVSLGSALALAATAWLLPETTSASARSGFDWVGAVSLMLVILGLLLATTTESLVPIGSPVNLAFWGISALAIVSLLRNARRKRDAFVGLDILRNRRFMSPALAVSLRMFAHDGARFLLALILANVFRQSPRSVGVQMLFYAVPLMIGVATGGYLADRWASRVVGVVGMIGQVAGLLWLAVADASLGAAALVPGMIVAGLASGMNLVALTKEAIGALGERRVGLASGLYNTIRFAGTAAATPLLGLLLASGFAQQGGDQTVSGPYQLAFGVAAGVAALGAVAAALIPAPAPTPTLPRAAGEGAKAPVSTRGGPSL